MDMESVNESKLLLASSDEGFHFKCDPCEYEGNNREAKFFCFACNEYLCDACKQFHQKLAATRKHQIVSGGLMPEEKAYFEQAQNESASLCACNDGKEVTVYCKGDNEVICMDCSKLKHRSCETASIEKACVEMVLSTREQTLKHARELNDQVARLKQKRNEDMGSLKAQTNDCREKVNSFRKVINEHLDELEAKAMSDINTYEADKKGKIEQHLDTCNIALTKLEADRESLESTLTSEKQKVFIRNLKLSKMINYVNEALNDMNKEFTEPNISFACDRTLRCTNATSLGTVSTTKMKDSEPIIVDMTVKSSTQVDVKHKSDRNEPEISGSLFMPNGEMVLCDMNNMVLKVLDPEFRLKEQFKTSSMPWDISVMSHDEVVVSLPKEKSLAFFRVCPKLQIVSSILLDKACRGIAVCDGSMYVSFDHGKIHILDRNGQQMENVFNAFEFNLAYYITVPQTGILIVSEHNGNCIRLLENGKEQYNYNHSKIQKPLGMYVDGGLNVYVCSFDSHNVDAIDKNGKHVKTVLSATDGLNHPYTISFRESDSTLVVGGRSKLLVFKLG